MVLGCRCQGYMDACLVLVQMTDSATQSTSHPVNI